MLSLGSLSPLQVSTPLPCCTPASPGIPPSPSRTLGLIKTNGDLFGGRFVKLLKLLILSGGFFSPALYQIRSVLAPSPELRVVENGVGKQSSHEYMKEESTFVQFPSKETSQIKFLSLLLLPSSSNLQLKSDFYV